MVFPSFFVIKDIISLTYIFNIEIFKVLKINGEYIKEKYKNIQGQEFGEKLHQERVRWMKMQHKIK